MTETMTSMQRVLTTMSHKEPDRVPLFLALTMHGAKELGLSIKEYFSKAEYLVEGQIKMQRKFRNDCYVNFCYASQETEAWGGDVVYMEDGPPNSGRPFIRKPKDIENLKAPAVMDCPGLRKLLDSARMLKAEAGGAIPVLGVVISPFSVPVMQMGFDKYLELIYEEPMLFNRLMEVNKTFCIEWANAQLEAGATAIVYFDPVSSAGIMPRTTFMKTGFEIAREVISAIKGPVAYHFASERCLTLADVLPDTGAIGVGVSTNENLVELKKAYAGRMTLLGNLNGVAMRKWSRQDAEKAVRTAIAQAGCGGGFILSDNHGEIPFQVPDETLIAISDAVRKWGTYPLKESHNDGK